MYVIIHFFYSISISYNILWISIIDSFLLSLIRPSFRPPFPSFEVPISVLNAWSRVCICTSFILVVRLLYELQFLQTLQISISLDTSYILNQKRKRKFQIVRFLIQHCWKSLYYCTFYWYVMISFVFQMIYIV